MSYTRDGSRKVYAYLTAASLMFTMVPAGLGQAEVNDAQRQRPPAAAGPSAIPEAAARYHKVLRKRPEPGYLFDRFCGAWIAESSAESLEAFLREQADGGADADGLLLAFYYTQDGRQVDAIRQFEATLAAHPDNAIGWFQKARLEAATLDFEAALSDLTRAQDVAGEDVEFLEQIVKLRGQLLVRTGQREEAVAAWEALAARRPEDQALREDLVQLRVEEGMFAEALQSLEALIADTRDPRERVARRMWLAEIHQRANERDKAIAIYTATLGDVGTGSWFERELLAQIESAYRRADDLVALRDRFGELAGSHADRIEVARRYARLLGELGEIDKAVEVWQDLINRTPEERSNRVALARLLAENDRTREAIERLEAMPGMETDPSLRIELAELRVRDGDEEGAEREMRAFVEASGGGLSPTLRAVRVLERLGQGTVALEIMRAHVAADEEDPGRREALAEVEYRIGKTERAVEIWQSLGRQAEQADGVISAARALIGRGEREAGYEVLAARAAEFPEDGSYARAMTEAAVRVDKNAEALEAATSWVRLARDIEVGEQAVRAAARIARRQEAETALVARLEELGAQRSTGETCLLAVLHQELGEIERADAVIAAAPTGIRTLRLRAQLLTERGAFEQAVASLEQLLDQPGAAQAATVRDLVNLSERTGQEAAARRWLDRWKEISPGSVTPWLREAELLAKRGNFKAGIETLEAIRRRQPEDVLVASQLAAFYGEAGRDRDAERIYWDLFESAESTPSRLRWIGQLAELAQWSGRADHLIDVLKARRANNRRSAEPSLLLAEALRVLGREREQREALVEASRLEPHNVDLILQIAGLQRQAGEIEQALTSLRRAAPLDTTGRVQAQIADLLVLDGRLDEAIAIVTRPESGIDADGLLRVANSMASVAEWEAAASLLSENAAHQGDYRFGYLHAVALEESGLNEAAQRMFLRVLDHDQERPGAASATTPQQAYVDAVSDILPRAAIELMEVTWAESEAYAHANQNAWTYGSSGGQQVVQLPTTLHESRTFSVYHLTRLAKELDQAARDLLEVALTERGVGLADVLVDLPPSSDLQMFATGALIESHPDDPAVLAMAVLMNAYNATAERETLLRAVETFGSEWPTLTLMARLALFNQATTDEIDATWSDVRTAMADVEHPGPWSMFALANVAAGGMMSGGGGNTPPADEAAWLLRELIRWYEDLDRNSQYHGQALMVLVMAVSQAEDAALTADLINAEVAAHRANPRGSARNPMSAFFGGPGMSSGLTPLSLPPDELQGLPSTVLSLLGSQSGFGFGAAGIDPSGLDEALGASADPLLRAVIAAVRGDEQQFGERIGALMSAETPSLDAYLLSAAWAGQQGESVRAVELLGDASYLPMARAMRERLDAAIISYALETSLEDRIAEIAQKSALRLLFATSDPQMRRAVAEALDDLGLEEAAERELDRLAAQPAGGGSAAAPWRGGSSSGNTSLDRIVDALDGGRETAGLRLIVRDLEQLSDQVQSGNYPGREHPALRALADLIASRDLEEAVIAQADPGERAGVVRLIRFGKILNLLERTDEAEEVFARAWQERKDLSTAAPLLEFRIDRGESDRAAEILAALPERLVAPVCQSLMMSVMSRNDEFDRVLTVAEMVEHSLEKLPSDRVHFLEQLAVQTLEQMSSPVWSRFNSLPSIYALHPEVPKGSQELQERRLATHKRLIQAMLDEPALAEAAFGPRYALALLNKEDLEPLVDLAREILTREVDRSAAARNNQMSYSFMSNSHAGDEMVAERTAIDVIAERTAGEDPEGIAAQVVAAFDAGGRKADLKRFESLRRLYGAESADFGAAAAAHLEGDTNPMAMMADIDRLGDVIEILRRRGFDPIVALDAIIASLEDAQRLPWGIQAYEYSLADYAELVFERHGADGVGRLAEDLAETLIGPADERARIIERNASMNGRMSPRARQLSTFRSILESIHQRSPETIWVAARHLVLFPEQEYGDSLGEVVTSSIRSFLGDDERKPSEIVAFLRGSTLAADGDDFRDFELGSSSRQRSAFWIVVRFLRSSSHQEEREAVLAWLDGLERQTLGTRLLAAAIREDESDRFEVLAELAPALAQLDEQTRYSVLLALGNPQAVPDGLSKGAAEALAGLMGLGWARLQEEVEAFLSERSANTSPWEVSGTAADLIAQALAERDPELAERVFAHAMKELRRTSGGNGQSLQWLYRAILRDETAPLESLAFCLRNLGETAPEMWSDWSLQTALARGVNDIDPEAADDELVRQASDDADLSEQALRLRIGLLRIRSTLADGDSCPLVPALSNYVEQHEALGGTHESLLAWVARRRADDAASTLWTDVEAAVHLARIRGAGDDPDIEDVRWVRDYLATLVGRETTPAAIRCLMVGESLERMREADLEVDAIARPAMALTLRLLEESSEQVTPAMLRPLLTAQVEAEDLSGWPPASDVIERMLKSAQQASDSGEALFAAPTPFSHASPKAQATRGIGLLTLELALRAGLEDQVQRLMRTPATGLRKTPAVWAMLVRHGDSEQVAAAIEQHWRDALPSFPDGVTYDELLHTRLPDLLEQIEDPHLRLYAEAAMVVLPDPEGDEDGPAPAWGDRGARAERLASRLLESDATGPARERVALMLSTADGALDVLADELASAADDRLRTGSARPAAATIAREELLGAIRADLRRGGTVFFAGTLNARADRTSSQDHEAAEATGQILQVFWNEILARFGSLSDDEAGALITMLEELLGRANLRALTGNGNSESATTALPSVHAVLSVMRRGPEAYDAFVSGLELGEDESLSVGSTQVIKLLLALPEFKDPDARIAAFRRVFTRPSIAGQIGDHDVLFTVALKEELLSAAQLAEHGMDIAEAIGDDAWMPLCMAAAEAKQGDLADAAWRRAMATQEESGGQLHYLRHMVETERFKLALEFLEPIETSDEDEVETKRGLMQRARAGLEAKPERATEAAEGGDA